MGMCAEIIAIGPYTRSIAPFLDYRPDVYERTAEGAVISLRLFGISEGSTVSQLFASHLGINDPWDFNQHKINCQKIDFAELAAFARLYDSYTDDVTKLEVLVNAGFEVHFRPEG